MTYLIPVQYDLSSRLQNSDQITVPREVWEQLHHSHEAFRPIFVSVGDISVGRLCPSVSGDCPHDSCRIPNWMWDHLGVEPNQWVLLKPVELPDASTIVLRARQEATLTGSKDVIAMLTSALSGSDSAPSWACLSAGAELPLPCGIFDIISIMSGSNTVPAACILDIDVNLELIPALDAVPVLDPIVEEEKEESDGEPVVKGGFVPFSGAGRRLGSSL
jgi:hypothetical protein